MARQVRCSDYVRLRWPLNKIWPGVWVVSEIEGDDLLLRKPSQKNKTLGACRHEVGLCTNNEVMRGLDGQECVVKKNRRLINKILKEITNERKN